MNTVLKVPSSTRHYDIFESAESCRRMNKTESSDRLDLRVGHIVEVRSKHEILATLDATGRLDNLPFMPEMLQHCGKRFRVYKRADKTCDTIGKTGSRRMERAVHLENIRCDGSAHGGCQAGCLIFWKEAWLKEVANTFDGAPIEKEAKSLAVVTPTQSGNKTNPRTEDVLYKATRREKDRTNGEGEIFSCQATELRQATDILAWWDVRQYLRDVRSGNIDLTQLIRGLAIAAFNLTIRNVRHWALGIGQFLTVLWAANDDSTPISITPIVASVGAASGKSGIKEKIRALLNDSFAEYPRIRGKMRKTPSTTLNLQPGEWVQVKSKQEILETLDSCNRNRGLSFDVEMLPYCDKTFRVIRRVGQIINERTGKLIRMPNDCIILEGVACGGCFSRNRLFCPRSIYPYWREIWLKRVNKT